ncbi:glucose 1-dehydrogenase [Asticcacaulis excentricus]|uniref:D-xylose 1-dehydrogenase n=1 Tax=Asticcacaulis excentricus (strain ATCC 15261 / DSM 4724 / KCTC 12464 / NCIMB 9791 / VKM B-1370 / CB 48) TaxID=573065 RepID=E8RUV5_ASTEC|nr:glucose 1-dehydrogenase [Asticcacaulis excentricus]ADU14155.1 short-chain dehydrogenase/reductase SDR [Asticcacaulis excentricus CB 48]
MDRLKDKVALVTGGAQGIGKAIVRSFAAEGARVIIADIDPREGKTLAAELPGTVFRRLDVSDEAQWIAVLDSVVADFGRLDVLVNNAGITGRAEAKNDPEHTTLEDWRRVMTVNTDGVFLGCKHAIRVMRPNRTGSIINMSSRSGLVGIPHQAAYAASKAAVRNHTKTVALYCAEEGLNIRCNSVHPAAILTPMWEAMLKDEADKEKVAAGTPLHRFGRPDEVAAVVLLLASDEATFITGSEFNIDGGVLAGTAASPK